MSVEAMLGVQRMTARVSHAAFRVLMTLAEHADKQGRNTWPSVDTIAAEAQADEKTVRRCLAKLQEDGLISGQPGRGRGNTTVWALLIPVPTLEKEGVTPGIRPDEDPVKPGTTPPIVDVKPGIMPVKAGITPVKPGTTPPEPVKNLSITEEGSLRSLASVPVRAVPKPNADGFETWWTAYPRKVAKDGAQKAYTAAVKRGAEPPVLLAAVQRAGWPDEAQFIPHPATWLNQGRWQDDPGAAAPAAGHARAPPYRETREEERRRKLGIASFFDLDEPHHDASPATPAAPVIDHEPDRRFLRLA